MGIDIQGTPNLRRIDFVAPPTIWKHAHVAHSVLYDFNTAARTTEHFSTYADVKALLQSNTFAQQTREA